MNSKGNVLDFGDSGQIIVFLKDGCIRHAFKKDGRTLVPRSLASEIASALDPRGSLNVGKTTSLQGIRTLVNRLEVIGWRHIVEVSDSFETVTLCVSDRKRRSHVLKIDRTNGVVSSESLPMPLAYKIDIVELFEAFKRQISELEPLWDGLDELDREYHVVDPTLPAPARVLRRRLVLETPNSSKTVFLEVKLSCLIGTRSLWVDIIGAPTESTRILRERLYNIKWNHGESLAACIANACDGFGILAKKGNEQQAVSTEFSESVFPECGVCYVYRLESDGGVAELPDASCQECSRPYHVSCIQGWLMSLQSTRTKFNVLIGDCPYCGRTMSLNV